jgi:sugar transferase (PEP-CTERM/EpsH1 system associated)
MRIEHIVFRFDTGGLETGVVNLVNGLPADRFEHAIIALTEATEFRQRIQRADVAVHALGKRPGNDLRMYWRLMRLVRRLRPDVVHTRNFGTLDCLVIAWLAGVRYRVHGEHGRDINDPDGTVRKYQVLRRMLSVVVTRWVAVSRDLAQWLSAACGIRRASITQIYNGVDVGKFQSHTPGPRANDAVVTVGSVTRFQPIKDPLNLTRAFIAARRELAPAGIDLRLVMVGEGSLRAQAVAEIEAAGCSGAAWFAGERDDVAQLLTSLDIFVLGSQREGVSNTILEAMAAGLPVVATATGGNLEVVEESTGILVPVADAEALAAAISRYARDGALRRRHGAAGRELATTRYSLERMLQNYAGLYQALPNRAAEVT